MKHPDLTKIKFWEPFSPRNAGFLRDGSEMKIIAAVIADFRLATEGNPPVLFSVAIAEIGAVWLDVEPLVGPLILGGGDSNHRFDISIKSRDGCLLVVARHRRVEQA